MVNEKFKQAVLDAYRDKQLMAVRGRLGIFQKGDIWVASPAGRCCGIGALLAGEKARGPIAGFERQAASMLRVKIAFIESFELGFDGADGATASSPNGYDTGRATAEELGLDWDWRRDNGQ